MRKISQALAFASIRGYPLTNPPPPDSKDREAEYDRLLHRRKGKSGSEFAGIGLQLAITIVLFAFGGIWLDERLGTSPWLVIVMVFGGAALGFWSTYRRLMAPGSGRQDSRQKR